MKTKRNMSIGVGLLFILGFILSRINDKPLNIENIIICLAGISFIVHAFITHRKMKNS